MINKIYFFVLSFILFVTSGCAILPHIPLSKENKLQIKTVYINPEMNKPEKMYAFASGQEYGAIVALAYAIAGEDTAESVQQLAEENSIDIRKIIYNKWKTHLLRSSFKLDNHPNDTILVTDIVLYGISIPHGFSTDYVPILSVNAKLIKNKKVIWQDNEHVLPLTAELPRFKKQQLFDNPKNLKFMWDQAAEIVIKRMLFNMQVAN